MILACRNGELVGLDIPWEIGTDLPLELGRMLTACIVLSDEDWIISFSRPRRKPWNPETLLPVRVQEEWAFKRDREMYWRCIVWMVDQQILYPWDARLNRFQVNKDLIRTLA